MSPAVLAAAAASVAVCLWVAPRPRDDGRWPTTRFAASAAGPDEESGSWWLRRYRAAWAALGALAWATFVGGPIGVLLAAPAGAAVWIAATRAEPPDQRRRRDEVRRDLPALVLLLAAALRSGAAPGEAVALVARALPGAAADRLGALADRLTLGVPPATVWADLAADPGLAPLGRTLGRAHRTGAPVVAAVERLAAELAEGSRADVEDRARAIGVRAAVPLGVCLLASFVLVGIVPLAAGLLDSITW